MRLYGHSDKAAIPNDSSGGHEVGSVYALSVCMTLAAGLAHLRLPPTLSGRDRGEICGGAGAGHLARE